MYFPTTRVLTVLEMLQSHQRLSGPDIAERLEVNPRTVRRYITMLQDLGIPVEAERGLDLYGLVYRAGYWYAVGYCHLREDLRVFRLDRVLHAEIGQDGYTRPTDFDCLAYVTRSIALTPAGWLVDVLLETTLEEAQHMVPPALATLEQAPNGIGLRRYTNDLDWIAHLAAGLDCPLVIRQPAELREALQRLAERISEMAGRIE